MGGGGKGGVGPTLPTADMYSVVVNHIWLVTVPTVPTLLIRVGDPKRVRRAAPPAPPETRAVNARGQEWQAEN